MVVFLFFKLLLWQCNEIGILKVLKENGGKLTLTGCARSARNNTSHGFCFVLIYILNRFVVISKNTMHGFIFFLFLAGLAKSVQ